MKVGQTINCGKLYYMTNKKHLQQVKIAIVKFLASEDYGDTDIGFIMNTDRAWIYRLRNRKTINIGKRIFKKRI